MKIQVTIKNVYGNQTIYPACEISKKFAALVGQKTLTLTNVQLIKAMGYEIEIVNQTVKL